MSEKKKQPSNYIARNLNGVAYKYTFKNWIKTLCKNEAFHITLFFISHCTV